MVSPERMQTPSSVPQFVLQFGFVPEKHKRHIVFNHMHESKTVACTFLLLTDIYCSHTPGGGPSSGDL